MTAALSAHAVSVSVGDTNILRDISLELEPGTVTGIIGPNGAGKSTLLATLSGDLSPTSGDIQLDGKSLHSYGIRDRARKRAVMLQDVSVSFSYLVRDIVEMGRSPYPKDSSDALRVDRVLEEADVTELQDRVITTLSGGERARVAFARVLCQDTPVVLLDEPTAALDIKHQEQLLSTVRDLANSGVAVAVVLHDLNLAAAYCDNIALMQGGALNAFGSPRSVLTSERLSEVYECHIVVTALPMNPEAMLITPVR